MNKFILMLLSAVVISCSFTNSAIAEKSNVLILGEFNVKSHIVRSEIARDLLSKVRLLSDSLPNPTPSDSTWVKQEKIDIDKIVDMSESRTSRLLRYDQSPEFRHVRLHTVVNNIFQSLSCAAAPNTSLSMEMYCWSVASFYLTEAEFINDSVNILIKSGRLSNNFVGNIAGAIGSKEIGYGYWLKIYGRGIHEYIVNPYLNGQIK
jgi:hypothetical protein